MVLAIEGGGSDPIRVRHAHLSEGRRAIYRPRSLRYESSDHLWGSHKRLY